MWTKYDSLLFWATLYTNAFMGLRSAPSYLVDELSSGGLRASSATPLCLVFNTDRRPHSTIYRHRQSLSVDTARIGTIYHSMSFLHLRCLSSSRASRLIFPTSCKYPSSERSCLGPSGLYSLGPCGPLSAVFIALRARSIVSALRDSVNDLDLDLD